MTPTWYLPRRTILRGMGAGVALPLLEAMVLPGKARKAAAAAGSPRRLVGIWGLPSGGKAIPDETQGCYVSPWTPANEGPLTTPDATGFLDPYFGKGAALGAGVGGLPFRDVSSKLTILTGVSDAAAGHAMNATMLGPRMLKCPTVGRQYTDADGNCRNSVMADVGGPTIDQIAAAHYKKNQPTAIDSLALGTMAGSGGDIRGTYSAYISWSSATQHVKKDANPGDVFDRLFGAGMTGPREDKAAAALRKANRTSVLDVILKQASSVKARLGRQDQGKISQYFDGVRDLEKVIASGDVTPPACGAGGMEKPTGAMFSTLDKRIKIMTDLIVKAFECDLTRVATLMYQNGNSGIWSFLGLSHDHHAMSHWNNPDEGASTEEARAHLDKYSKFALQMNAYFMGELDKRTDLDGNTLLDNTIMFMSGDFGDGGHSFASTNVLLGGRGGRDPMTGTWGVRAGRHVRCSPRWKYCFGGGLHDSYCPDPNHTDDITVFAPQTEALRVPGERTTKDLLWGMLKAIGIPDSVITGGQPTFGYATAPIDLTFPGKA